MTFPDTGPHPGAGSGRWSGTADHPDQRPLWRRSCCLGCLALPLVGVLVLSVYATVQSFQGGRFVPFPEVSGPPEWTAEGLPGENLGGWWAEERIVQVSEEGLTAVSTADGEQLWRLEPDTRVCGTGEETAGGIGVVLLEGDHEDPEPRPNQEEDPARSCDEVLAVGLDDGNELWRTGPLLEAGNPEERYREELDVSVHGDGVVVRIEDELRGLDAADGSRLWSREELSAEGSSCPAVGLGTRDSERAVSVADCGLGDQLSVHVFDARSGEDSTAFTYERAPAEFDDGESTVLLNSDPVVVHLDLGHRRGPDLDHDPEETESGFDDPHWEQTLVFDDDGAFTALAREQHWVVERTGSEPNMLFTDDRLYTSPSSTSCSADVEAHDLETGEELWTATMDGSQHRVLAKHGEHLLVIRDETAQVDLCDAFTPTRQWQFYLLDTATGEGEPLSNQLGGFDQPEPGQVWWHGEHVYFIEEPVGRGPSTVVAL